MAQRNSGYDRITSDVYNTPPWVTEALLQHISVRGAVVWEPAAGCGMMADVLEEAGAGVFRSDVNPHRGLHLAESFFDAKPPHGLRAIVTNPPYGTSGALSERFCRRSIKLMQECGGFVAMLLKVDFDSGKSRRDMFGECPHFAMKLVLNDRIVWFDPKPGDAGPSENHAWFYWSYHHQGPAQIRYARAPEHVLAEIRRKRSRKVLEDATCQ